MASCLDVGMRFPRGEYPHRMALATVHFSPLSVAIGVAIYLVIIVVGPTPPIPYGGMPRFVGAVTGLAYAGALFGTAIGGAAFAVTDSAKLSAMAGAFAGLLFFVALGLVAAVAGAVIHLLRPEGWEFAQAWSGAGFSVPRSWWSFRRFQQGRRYMRVFSALRKEWLSETGPRLSARDFLDARRTAIEVSLRA
jgi:hypothetical protein